MEPRSSLPHSHQPATFPYPEPALSSPYPTSHFLKIHLNVVLPSTPGSPKWYLPHQNPVYVSPLPLRATYPAHLILLDFITRTILGEQYRSITHFNFKLKLELCRRNLKPLHNTRLLLSEVQNKLFIWNFSQNFKKRFVLDGEFLESFLSLVENPWVMPTTNIFRVNHHLSWS